MDSLSWKLCCTKIFTYEGPGASESLEILLWTLPFQDQLETSSHPLFSIPSVTILIQANFITLLFYVILSPVEFTLPVEYITIQNKIAKSFASSATPSVFWSEFTLSPYKSYCSTCFISCMYLIEFFSSPCFYFESYFLLLNAFICFSAYQA